MKKSGFTSLYSDQSLFFILLAALVWAPLPFASNRPWAIALLASLLCVTAALWLILKACNRVYISARVARRVILPLSILLFIALWPLIQVIPLPAGWVETLSPRAAQLHVSSGWNPLSLDVGASLIYFLNGLACLTAFFLVVVLVNNERRATVFLWVLVASGLFQAVYGALMVLTGLEWGFFVKKYVGHGQATGTFVNRNHLAGYLVMTIAVGTGLLISQLSSRPIDCWRELVRRSLQMMVSPKIFLRLFLAMMVIALVLTRSRMGNSSFFVALAVAGLVAILVGRKFSPKLAILLVSLLVIDTWIVGQWFGIDKVVERLEKASPAAEVRINASSDSYAIVEDFPLTGAGGGSFGSVFTYYQGIDTAGYYDHAHNDYLEIAADLGIPAVIFLILLCGVVGWRAVIMQRRSHSKLQRGVGFCLIMVLVWLVMHSLVDFNLQIPANNITLCAIFGLAFSNLISHRK